MTSPRALAAAALIASLTSTAGLNAQQPQETWPQHSRTRPAPPVEVAPLQSLPVAPPRSATVLFDGRDLSSWQRADSTAARWTVLPDGAVEVAPGIGDIETKDGFGDVRLHVEWASPSPAVGEDQDRGNSGVFLMGRYEVQVLDSYNGATYPDGQAGAIYGQYPPRVNVSSAPGEWQSFDIEFRRPRFGADGTLVRPGRLTVRHNGVLVQDDVTLLGPTSHRVRAPYEAHADQLPIKLQDHGHRVRFRNIWLQPLTEGK